VSPSSQPPRALGVFRRGEPGSVLRLRLSNGQFGYVQYVCPGWFGSAIRVLPGTYDESLGEAELRRLVAGPSLFRTQYGIDREWRRSGAKIVARLPIPDAEAGMPPFRMAADPADDEHSWVKRPDGTSVRNPQYAAENPGIDFDSLPLSPVPFFGTLSWMMETQWTPRLAEGLKLNLPDRLEPPAPEPADAAPATKRRVRTSYLAVFPSEQAAVAAHEELRDVGVKAPFGYDEDNLEWFLRFEKLGRPDDVVEAQISEVAQRHGGYLEGHLVGPFN